MYAGEFKQIGVTLNVRALKYSSKWYRWILPDLTWSIEEDESRVYLTFDDGPHPEITPYVLDILDKYGFKASFFCIGDNVVKHPETYNEVLSRGHRVGNHTFNHLNGFQTSNSQYIDNVAKAAEVIDSTLFRPPYGRINDSQRGVVKKKYEIVMWDILTHDYSPRLNKSDCLQQITKLTKPGSIIVFHDSTKAQENLEYLLPKYCEFLAANKYISCQLP